MSEITLAQQLACAKRELKQRQNVYPRLGWMSEEKKAYELAAMQAIIETLEALVAAENPQLTLMEG